MLLTTRREFLATVAATAVASHLRDDLGAAGKPMRGAFMILNTPFTATCRACHSRPNALAHFRSMGGSVNTARAQADPAAEACVTCHGTTGPNALFNVHRFSVVSED